MTTETHLTPKVNAAIRAEAIVREVAERHGVSYRDIVGHSRIRHIVCARYAAIRAVYAACPEMSSPRIGRLFNRDHTSILYAVGRTKHTKQSPINRNRQALGEAAE